MVPKVKVEPTNDSAAASASNPFVQAAEFFKATVPSDARGTALQSPIDQLISPFKCALHCTVARRCRCPPLMVHALYVALAQLHGASRALQRQIV